MLELRCIEIEVLVRPGPLNFRISLLTNNPAHGVVCHAHLSRLQLNERHVILTSDLGIVLTECRRDMNNACTVCQRYIGSHVIKNAFLFCLAAQSTRTGTEDHTLCIPDPVPCMSQESRKLDFLLLPVCQGPYQEERLPCSIRIPSAAFTFRIVFLRIYAKCQC